MAMGASTAGVRLDAPRDGLAQPRHELAEDDDEALEIGLEGEQVAKAVARPAWDTTS
jgi:hypothetical protein